MNRARLLALLLIPLAVGCDIAVAALLASRGGGSKKSPSSPSAPDPSFFVYVADLSAVTDITERDAIATAGGNPGGNWTLIGSGTTTMEFDVALPNINGILIQATDAQVYHIDAFEILDATSSTIGVAKAGTLFSDHVNNMNLIENFPNAVVADTNATAANKAFVFFHHGATITRFRVNLWKPTERNSGDLEWVATFALASDQLAGGAAVNSAGRTYLTFRSGTNIFLLRHDPNGNIVQDSIGNDLTSLESTVSTSVGSAAVAIDQSNDDVFIATTRNAGDIRLYKFVGNANSPSWTFPALAGAGVDRVEPNGLALDANGDLILAGGFDAQGVNKVQHYVRKHSKVDGSDMWVGSPPPASPADTNDTYWYAVATTGTNGIILTGNQAGLLTVPPIDIRTQRLLDSSPTSVTETWNEILGSGGSNMAIGRSVGVDAAQNAFIGGYYTHADLDSVILRYGSAGPAGSVFFPPSNRTGDDEILDLVVEADGTIYAVGYETNGAQGSDLVLYKIAPNAQVVWKRTVSENGDDRGVSVMTTATHVIVVGEIAITPSNKDIHVRKYVK